MAFVTSDNIVCTGHLPKYIFVISLENRSFDHLFGRSNLSGKDAVTGADTKVNGVLKDDGSIDPQWNNEYDGKVYPVPDVDAQYIMPGDPKHEYEHILCQTCGSAEATRFYKECNIALPKGTSLADVPVPPQSNPGPGIGPFVRQQPDNSGFIYSWVKSFTKNKVHADDPTAGTPDNIDEVMRCFSPAQLPVLMSLAQNFAICDNFFSSLPGPTGPNRFFMMGASSAGYDHSPSSSELTSWQATGRGDSAHLPLANGNIFSRLQGLGAKWQVFADDNFPMAAVCEGVHTQLVPRVHGGALSAHALMTLETLLTSSLAPKEYPYNFTWIEPDFDTVSATVQNKIMDHPTYSSGNSMHPCSDVRKAEEFISDIYGWIRNNDQVWPNCAIFITWDEHGGFYDHVIPPDAPPPEGKWYKDPQAPGANQWGFKFDKFGIRVPCLVVSPLVKPNIIDHRQYDHTSIIQTVRDLFNSGAFNNGQPPTTKFNNFTARDDAAAPLTGLFSLMTARTDCPKSLPKPNPAGAAQPNSNDAPLTDDQLNQPIIGNLATHLAVAMNQLAAIDSTFDRDASMAAIHTMGDAAKFIADADAKINAKRAA